MAQEKPIGKYKTPQERREAIRQAMLEHQRKKETDPEYRARSEENQKRWGEMLGYDRKD